eukprot:6182076-Pleurochrysis_carterae.AAC.2
MHANLHALQQTDVQLKEKVAALMVELTACHTAETNRLPRDDRERRASARESSATAVQLAAAEKREAVAAAAAEKARGEAELAKAVLDKLAVAVREAEGARDAAEVKRDTVLSHEAMLLR